ncbi:MAG: tRNA uridine-5-carboxymethylaminomethyl(34) synthesis GTPase MnmE [Gammaproteobacteria bacterium]|jgi:tRNA modification GTPase|nr:tRNA uridine-5-carboxymethylaminomethyl(34) synthesis GTPase MnmE [Gammaproteobacteria bacterium]
MPEPKQFASPDTIVACATAAGRGGIAVVRVSGSQVSQIAAGMLGRLPPPRLAELMAFRDGGGSAIDTGLALYFPAPHSFTGEDVLELHAHGSPVVVEMLIERACELGARPARPGEFSSRAFLNDKLDLAQAEAIADLIDSASRTAARAAQRSLRGDFSATVLELNAQVTALRVHVEAALDFPEEEIDFLADAALHERVARLREQFAEVERTVRQGCLLRDGVTLVLAGRPNAGKSSLLNALAGYDAAIVTPVAGTTRDVVRETIELDGLRINLIDTAGLRTTADCVEEEGVRRAQAELARADHALIIVDSSSGTPADSAALLAELPSGLSLTWVQNKIDLSGLAPGWLSREPASLGVSARTGAGLDLLRGHLAECFGYNPVDEGAVTARRRHLQSLAAAQGHFAAAVACLTTNASGELMAEELLQVQNALAEITGQFSSDDLLGEIFASFCIGK